MIYNRVEVCAVKNDVLRFCKAESNKQNRQIPEENYLLFYLDWNDYKILSSHISSADILVYWIWFRSFTEFISHLILLYLDIQRKKIYFDDYLQPLDTRPEAL